MNYGSKLDYGYGKWKQFSANGVRTCFSIFPLRRLPADVLLVSYGVSYPFQSCTTATIKVALIIISVVQLEFDLSEGDVFPIKVLPIICKFSLVGTLN